MEDIEDLADREENLSEYAEEKKLLHFFLPKYPRNSFLRQILCLSSVLAIPFLNATFSPLGHTYYPHLAHYALEQIQTIGQIVGYIFGCIVWYLNGSRSLVVISHLLYIVLAALAIKFYEYLNRQNNSMYVVSFVMGTSELGFYVYTAEISDHLFRAFFMGLHPIINYLTYIKLNDYFLSDRLESVHWPNFIVAIVFFLLSLLVPETPFSIARKGNYSKARAIFEWIRAEQVDEFEYEMMIEKAESILQHRGIASKIFSSNFFFCMIASFIIAIAQSGRCDMSIIIAYDYYFQDDNTDGFLYDTYYYFDLSLRFFYHIMFFGCIIYQVLCFYIPRKKLFTVTVVLHSLLAVPVAMHEDYELIATMLPLCNLIPSAGLEQTKKLLPIEIFPAASRFVGVTASYIIETIGYFMRVYDTPVRKPYGPEHALIKLPRKWTYFSQIVAITGIPFILLLVPETMGKNLYEVDN